MLKALAFALLENTGLIRFFQNRGAGSEQRLYVLAYHRVDEANHRPWLNPHEISASPQQFDAQMRLLASAYKPVTLEQVLEAFEGNKRLPKNAVLITVDDGYRDFQEVIIPITNRYRIRPVLFVPTAHVGSGNFWWDRLYQAVAYSSQTELFTALGNLPIQTPAEKEITLQNLSHYLKHIPAEQTQNEIDQLTAGIQLPPQRNTLDWDELRQLARAGVAVAPHTHTHSILSRVSTEQAAEEIRQSFSLLRQEIGDILPVFAFPDGTPEAFTPQVIDILKNQGFKLVFTMIEKSIVIGKANPLCLPRLGIWRKLTLPQFHWHLTPYYHQFRT